MEPTLEALNLFKKKELIDAAKHFNLEVNECVSKAELKKLVLDYLVEELMAEPEFTLDLLQKWWFVISYPTCECINFESNNFSIW